MSLSSFSLLLLLLSLLHQPPFSTANLHKTTTLFRSQLNSTPNPTTNTTTPTTFFEVTKPLHVPKTKPFSHLILQHDFAYTYTKPPVLTNYTPPSQEFSKVVLEWRATCKGRQFDRIFGVWLGGVELLRSCTAEPTSNGIFWSVEKDISKYYSLLMSNQTLAVYLGNIVDNTYTGVYHVEIFMHFYPSEVNLKDNFADLILPISRNLPLNDGLWFKIANSSDLQSKEVVIPQNVYRAVLEVYVSFHENDEFWYGNVPNEYIFANNLTGVPGNGPFREVLVSLDDKLVGAVWPFTVIFTGGVNPLLWRPISAIGSFDLPTYDIEITPFLEMILDGKTHKFGFRVTNALNVWYINANLHLWLDKKSEKTEAKLLKYNAEPLEVSLSSNFTGFNGSFYTNASRSIKSTGWVKSSHGTITTEWNQDFSFSNFMVMGNEGNLQILNQIIDFNDSVVVNTPSSHVLSLKSLKRFPFYLYSETVNHGNRSYTSLANLTMGFNEKRVKDSALGSSKSSLENSQSGQSSMLVKGNLVVTGLGSTQQKYRYKEDSFCYLRDISSSNYTILHDKVSYHCGKTMKSRLVSGLRPLSAPARRATLAFDVHDG